jgi:hypothetical protein
MDTKQLVLKLALEAAGQSLDVDSLDDRMRLQKAVYLLQAAGTNLGYHYSWYLKGPYSTALTQDYFAIAEATQAGNDGDDRTLKAELVAKVQSAAKVLSKPSTAKGLSTPHWYELLASLHYIHSREHLSGAALKNTLSTRKPHLAPFVDVGIDHLQRHNLA